MQTSQSVCFKTLHIPKIIKFRPGWGNQPTEFEQINLKMRSFLTRDFEKPKHNILISSHQDSWRKHWENAQDVIERLESEQGYKNITHFGGFYGISNRKQCQLFYDADVIIMVHGAQTANIICSRPGTIIVELLCQHFGWTSYLKEQYLKAGGHETLNPREE